MTDDHDWHWTTILGFLAAMLMLCAAIAMFAAMGNHNRATRNLNFCADAAESIEGFRRCAGRHR